MQCLSIRMHSLEQPSTHLPPAQQMFKDVHVIICSIHPNVLGNLCIVCEEGPPLICMRVPAIIAQVPRHHNPLGEGALNV